MAADRKTVGEKLRELRESYDLTQGQVAEALNINRSSYTSYEIGRSQPNLDAVVKLAHIFKVPPEYLLPQDSQESLSLRDIARGDSLLQTLSKDERGLIVLYRSLDSDARAKIREEMGILAKKQS